MCHSPFKFLSPLFACALACALPYSALADDEVTITPYRPTVSNPAQLPTPGQLEFESGILAARTAALQRNSLSYQFKLAFNEQWGLLLNGEALVHSDDQGMRATGVGDTNVVLKRAFVLDELTALGLEVGVKIPTAKNTIGSGQADYSINGIFSRDIGSVHLDTNLNLTHLGINDTAAGTQTGWSAALSTPWNESWGINLELSGTRRAETASTAQVLCAATFSPSKQMTVDVGLIRGLNNASPDWAFFTGIVIPVAKFW